MRVIQWEPFRDVDDMFDRFVAETVRRWPRQGVAAQPMASTSSRPSCPKSARKTSASPCRTAC
jgi:hypothetical protein